MLCADNKKQTLKRHSVRTICNEDSAYDDKYCQRCKCLLEIPLNEFLSSDRRIPGFIGQCEVELSFIQAIVWLKSITACVPQISVEKLQQLFDNKCNIRDQRSIKDIHVQSLATFPNKTPSPSVHNMFNNREQLTLSFNSILDSSYNISPMIHKSYINDISNESFNFVSSLKDQNKSVTELSKPGTSTGYVMTNEKRKEFLSRPYLIPDSDEESLSDLADMFEESVTCNDVEELLQNFEHKQTSRRNSNNQVNSEIIEDENINSIITSTINSTLKNDAEISSKYGSVSLSRCQSIESIPNLKCKSDNCIISLTGQSDTTNNMKTSNNYLTQLSISDINLSQIISPISYMTPREQNNANNFQTDQVQSKTLHHNDADFEYQINSYSNSSCIQSDTENEKNDSAYSTWEIETLNYDTATTKPTANKPDTMKHHYNLRPRKETKHKKTIASTLLIRKSIRKGQHSMEKSSLKKRKSKPAKNVSEKTKKNKNEVISANWLNFTAELLNAEYIIHTSVKVILSTICDKRTAQQYARHRYWKDSLEEQAVNAVLNIVDILKTEKKPNICEHLIETAIVETLDEMMTSVQLNEVCILYYTYILYINAHSLSIYKYRINNKRYI